MDNGILQLEVQVRFMKEITICNLQKPVKKLLRSIGNKRVKISHLSF